MKTLFAVLALVGAVAGGAAWMGVLDRGGEQTTFRTAVVERGDVVVTVGATGTLEPEEVIDVGAQVVGRVQEFGPDPRGETDPKFKDKRIDYGSPVEEGTVLALIDPRVYKAQYDQAKAALDRAEADLLQLQAKEVQTKLEWQRAQRLREMTVGDRAAAGGDAVRSPGLPIQAISNSDFILAQANYDVAKANVAVGKAVIEQQRGILSLAKTNLDFTVIASPVKGTIIDRRVNIGQTVVASLNAPSLFLLAQDLAQMQVWASVNEADIGQLKTGTAVSFTVDAFPGDVFHGVVEQIRLNASMTQNVVTYTVVVSVENEDLKLLPYLTADVKFEIQRRDDVLRVPNAALRFQPRPDQVAGALPAATADKTGGKPAGKAATRQAVMWVERQGRLAPIDVTTGLSDGAYTEVSGPEVSEGLAVVIGENLATSTDQVNNPFAPKFRGGKSK
jgi:HlyD family secretion protein